MSNQRLTPNFALNEFEFSQTADRLGINNSVPVWNLTAVHYTAHQLQKFRDWLSVRLEEDKPVVITSGYRSARLNKAIAGSAKNSAHMTGYAADICVPNVTTEELMRLIIEWLEESKVHFDQLINEYDSWVHISFAPDGRGQILKATRNRLTRRTIYTALH